MAIRRWIPLLLSTAMISAFAGCGGGSTIVGNSLPSPASSLAITFQPAPPGSIPVDAIATLTAVVSDDSSNSGVDWSLTCDLSAPCGSLSALHTGSGEAVTYTPPGSLPGNQQLVNIVAFATADQTRNALARILVTAYGSNLQGTYVFQTSGIDGSLQPYQFAGVITLDGNGGITSGEQTINTFNPSTNSLLSVSDPITGGSYFVGPDGRGTMTINTADQNIGQQGVETFSLVFLSSAQAYIAKMDDLNLPSTSSESSVGTLELQTSQAAPSGGYAFVVSGTDIAIPPHPTGFGGILNIDSPNTISGAGSVADQDLFGAVTNNAAISGTVSDPDPFGAVKFNLTAVFASTPIQFTGYIVDATHIRLIETDNSSGTGFGSTAGVAIGQGAATGTFTDNGAFSGDYVFGIFGEDFGGVPSSLSSAGVFTADGAGQLTGGFIDIFRGGLGQRVSRAFTGTYTVDANGTGRVDSFISFRHSGDGPEFIFYQTGNGNPPLILDADASANFGPSGVGGGLAYPAAGPISFSGRYGLSLTQSTFGSENDVTGQMTVDPTALALSGIVDTNSVFTPAPNTQLTGSFAPTAVPRRFTGTLSNELFFFPDIAVAYYIIDSSHGIFVETDPADFGVLSFGNFATRTPVCPDCP